VGTLCEHHEERKWREISRKEQFLAKPLSTTESGLLMEETLIPQRWFPMLLPNVMHTHAYRFQQKHTLNQQMVKIHYTILRLNRNTAPEQFLMIKVFSWWHITCREYDYFTTIGVITCTGAHQIDTGTLHMHTAYINICQGIDCHLGPVFSPQIYLPLPLMAD